jgi:hypothetical protein
MHKSSFHGPIWIKQKNEKMTRVYMRRNETRKLAGSWERFAGGRGRVVVWIRRGNAGGYYRGEDVAYERVRKGRKRKELIEGNEEGKDRVK